MEDNFSWGFNHFMDNKLGMVDISLRARRQFPVLDTYFDLSKPAKILFGPQGVFLLCSIGVNGLRE
jgi:hypothetical protein